MQGNLAAVNFNQMPVNTMPSQRQEGVFRRGFEEAVPFWWLLRRIRKRPGSVIEANLDPGNSPSDFRSLRCASMAHPTGVLTGPCDRSRVGIGVTYAAVGPV
jgi:hypothetical protein